MIKRFNSDPFLFHCYVEEDGYEWVRQRLVGIGGLGSRIQVREMPADVFLEFAKLEPTGEAVRGFAEKYGVLATPHGPETLVVVRDTLEAGLTLDDWATEIADMRVLVDVWVDIKTKSRRTALKKIITWKDNAVRYSIKTPKRHWRAWLTTPGSQHSGRFKKGDLLLPAKYALQNEINRTIADPGMATVPRLVWAREYLSDHIERERSRIVFTPPNLLAALWLQFARAISNLSCKVKECKGCHGYFLAGPGTGRRDDAETCKNACRQRFYDTKKSRP